MIISGPATTPAAVWAAASRTLTVDPATDAGAAALVWGHAARTLSADPATDAGAASLVWAHVGRSLDSDPATDAGAATLVWGHAARSLTVDPATDAGAATLVWGHAARSLTSIAGGITGNGATVSSLAAGAVFDTRPAANHFRYFDIMMTGGFVCGGFYDGTTFTLIPDTTLRAYLGCYANSLFGFTVKNSSAGALNVTWHYIDLG